jgi:hypothetical protein
MYKMLNPYSGQDEINQSLVGRKIEKVEFSNDSLYLTLDNGSVLEVEVDVEAGILEAAISAS